MNTFQKLATVAAISAATMMNEGCASRNYFIMQEYYPQLRYKKYELQGVLVGESAGALYILWDQLDEPSERQDITFIKEGIKDIGEKDFNNDGLEDIFAVDNKGVRHVFYYRENRTFEEDKR